MYEIQWLRPLPLTRVNLLTVPAAVPSTRPLLSSVLSSARTVKPGSTPTNHRKPYVSHYHYRRRHRIRPPPTEPHRQPRPVRRIWQYRRPRNLATRAPLVSSILTPSGPAPGPRRSRDTFFRVPLPVQPNESERPARRSDVPRWSD